MKTKGIIFILISAFGYGIMPVFVRIAYNNNVTMYEFLSIRFLIAIIALGLFMLTKRNPSQLKLEKKDVMKFFILGGILFAFTSITMYSSVYYLSPSVMEIIYFTYPCWVTLMSIFIYKEKLSLRKILFLAILFSGVLLTIDYSMIKINWKGILLAFLCSIIYSLYIIYSKNKSVQKYDGLIISFYVMFFADLSYLVFGLISNGFHFNMNLKGLGAIFIVAIFSTLIALVAFTQGTKHLKANEIAVIATAEPIVTILSDSLILHQSIRFLVVLGMLLIILSIYLSSKHAMD